MSTVPVKVPGERFNGEVPCAACCAVLQRCLPANGPGFIPAEHIWALCYIVLFGACNLVLVLNAVGVVNFFCSEALLSVKANMRKMGFVCLAPRCCAQSLEVTGGAYI